MKINRRFLKLKRDYSLIELDEMHFRLKCATDNVLAVHTAAAEGSFCGDSINDALFSSWLMLHGLQKELREFVDGALEAKKALTHS